MTWAVVILVAVGLLMWVVVWDVCVRGEVSYRDPFTRTRDEIRSLPETPDRPYDWSLEDAA